MNIYVMQIGCEFVNGVQLAQDVIQSGVIL